MAMRLTFKLGSREFWMCDDARHSPILVEWFNDDMGPLVPPPCPWCAVLDAPPPDLSSFTDELIAVRETLFALRKDLEDLSDTATDTSEIEVENPFDEGDIVSSLDEVVEGLETAVEALKEVKVNVQNATDDVCLDTGIFTREIENKVTDLDTRLHDLAQVVNRLALRAEASRPDSSRETK